MLWIFYHLLLFVIIVVITSLIDWLICEIFPSSRHHVTAVEQNKFNFHFELWWWWLCTIISCSTFLKHDHRFHIHQKQCQINKNLVSLFGWYLLFSFYIFVHSKYDVIIDEMNTRHRLRHCPRLFNAFFILLIFALLYNTLKLWRTIYSWNVRQTNSISAYDVKYCIESIPSTNVVFSEHKSMIMMRDIFIVLN